MIVAKEVKKFEKVLKAHARINQRQDLIGAVHAVLHKAFLKVEKAVFKARFWITDKCITLVTKAEAKQRQLVKEALADRQIALTELSVFKSQIESEVRELEKLV